MKINRILPRIRQEAAHRRNNRRVAAINRAVEQAAPFTAGARPVILFNASTRLTGVSLNAAYSQIAGWALRLTGTPVVRFVSDHGMSRCVLGTNRDDFSQTPPCRGCAAQSRSLYAGQDVRWFRYAPDAQVEGQIAGLGVDALANFTYQGVPLGQIILPAFRWVLRRHHFEDNEANRFLYRAYILSAWSLYQQFNAVLDDTDAQAVVVFNGQFYPEATARYAAQQRGLRVISHEVGLQPYSGYFTAGEATAYPIDIPESFELSDAQNARLDAYLEKRMQGNFSMAGIRFWPEMRPLEPAFWERAAKFRQIVPVFTNVVFDTSQGHANTIYAHMFAWLDDVLEVIRAHPETLFVLRAHPDESRPGKESRESVADWARQRDITELPNVLFVDAGEYFSSYELIQKSHFVMIYNSTIGLEASLLGAPVLSAGRARFTQLPTVFFPASAAEYRQTLEQFLAGPVQAPAAFRRNARRFLYYQLFRTSLPFGDFIEEDGIWRGYVRFKLLDAQQLRPENSSTLRAVVNGILHGGDFLLEE